MATPYDNHEPGYSREERRIADDYGIDLDAPEQKKCFSCNKLTDADELNTSGDCEACVAEQDPRQNPSTGAPAPLVSQQLGDSAISADPGVLAGVFLTAPTMAGCLTLMGVSR